MIDRRKDKEMNKGSEYVWLLMFGYELIDVFKYKTGAQKELNHYASAYNCAHSYLKNGDMHEPRTYRIERRRARTIK